MGDRRIARLARRSPATWLLVGLLTFHGVGAIGGGVTFLLDTSGGLAGLDPTLLAGTPVDDFLWPGVLLAVGFGLPALALVAGVLWRPRVAAFEWIESLTSQHWAWAGSRAMGLALVAWIVVQMLLIAASWFQPLMLVVGVALALLPATAGVRRDLVPAGATNAPRQGARQRTGPVAGHPAGVGSPAVEPGAQALDLYWLPLGAGASVVRFVIELTPVAGGDPTERGLVGDGPVGSRWLGRFRLFRYELHCWRDGVIPDVDQAVASPQRLTVDPHQVRQLLDAVPRVPTPVWGRDELGTGEMWNSNSVIAWLIASSGVSTASIDPPPGGRAPGWVAGLVVAGRNGHRSRPSARVDARVEGPAGHRTL
jgi:hypothetical protein